MKKVIEICQELAEQKGMTLIDSMRMAGAAFDEIIKENPNVWQAFTGGEVVNLIDSGLKNDCARNIGEAVALMDGEHNRPHLCEVVNVLEVTDEELQLFNYCDQVPAGDCGGGGCWGGDEKYCNNLQAWRKDGKPESDFYENYYTRVTMFKSPKYCIFIDSEGYKYCRYLLFFPTYETMYAEELQAIREKRQQREEAEALETLKAQTAAALAYSQDCGKIESLCKSVKDLPHNKRNTAISNNIKRVLHHFFPGVKFSIKHSGGWGEHFTVYWQDGPTEKAVESCCNWSIFCGWVASFDGMTDCDNSEPAEFRRFSLEYGGEFLSSIKFHRTWTKETLNELAELVTEKMNAEGLNPEKDFRTDSDEGRQLINMFRRFCSSDNFLFWVNRYSVMQQIFHQITY